MACPPSIPINEATCKRAKSVPYMYTTMHIMVADGGCECDCIAMYALLNCMCIISCMCAVEPFTGMYSVYTLLALNASSISSAVVAYINVSV